MAAEGKEITILDTLKHFITPLTKEELELLENNILEAGCRDPLVVWENNDKYVLIDGHNRYQICQKHGVDFKLEVKTFKNIDQVKDWMIDNQLGRRNLNPFQLSYFRGFKYERMKKKKGGYQYVKLKDQKGPLTSELLADVFKVSKNTIKRDAQFTKGLELIAKSNPVLKNKILSGDIRVNRAEVQLISEADGKTRIHNEKDLRLKAKRIKDKKMEASLTEVMQEETRNISAEWDERGDVFMQRDELLKSIKANILSSMNRVINDQDKKSMKELEDLVKKLNKLVFQYAK
ncbi:ParB N-terminal domain-containing protein [Flexithrix dorotheae]|uniref:ParB N-terminal domain-containing protein n=1 Tax=Flexithrix dorotheae TaxID=70993 RepID=UPI00037D42A3|nr:ParB N-terminal domain-containing protein [Flexithrix dorotheae]